jgi:phage-related baseplate assembly protein
MNNMQKIDLSSYAQQIIAKPTEVDTIIAEAKKAMNTYLDSIDKQQEPQAWREILGQIQQGVRELADMVKTYKKEKVLS